jgi:hypothetical protein
MLIDLIDLLAAFIGIAAYKSRRASGCFRF